MTVSTSFQIECISEPGKDYRVEIKESVGECTSKPGKDYRVTEIGVSLYIKWAKPELNNVDGDLRGASFIQSEKKSQKKKTKSKKKKKREMKSQSFTVKTQLSFIRNLLANLIVKGKAKTKKKAN